MSINFFIESAYLEEFYSIWTKWHLQPDFVIVIWKITAFYLFDVEKYVHAVR